MVCNLKGHGKLLCRKCRAVLMQCRCVWNPATHTIQWQEGGCDACDDPKAHRLSEETIEHMQDTPVGAGRTLQKQGLFGVKNADFLGEVHILEAPKDNRA